ncbi:TfoX/Sxy family protein [Nocardia sp. NPDC050712]|uniref:TfoX/Sxy family protein n=1 Tax=Nocardia sp. NPDC050712 TaxID=3155518 RepID=UPI0033D89814
MPFDHALTDRIREYLDDRAVIAEVPLFGGLAFLAHGRMFAGVFASDLWVRVRPRNWAAALNRPGARPLTVGNRPPARDCLYVAGEALDDEALDRWLTAAWDSLPETRPRLVLAISR